MDLLRKRIRRLKARVVQLEEERDSHQRVCIREMEKLRTYEARVEEIEGLLRTSVKTNSNLIRQISEQTGKAKTPDRE